MALLLMVVLLFLFVVVGKRVCKEWISPVYLCGTFWLTYTLFSYFFMRKLYHFSILGIAWINISVWAMLLFEQIGKRKSRSTTQVSESPNSISNISWIYLKLCCFLGFLAFIYQVSLYGFSFSSFTSLDALATMNNTIAVARYTGNSITNIVTQILLIFVYAAPACGGFAFVYAESLKDKIWALVTFVPGFFMVLFTNTKAVIIGVVILWASAYLVSYYFRHKAAPKINIRVFLIVSIIGVILFSFLFLSMVLRIGEISENSINDVINKFKIYAFGSVQSFDWWCGNEYKPTYRFGVMTYLGIADFVGLAQKVQGVYTAYAGTSSNVFTVFRGIIEDYGYWGGIIYLAIKSFLGGMAWRTVCGGKRISVLSLSYLVSEIFFLLYGFIISPWTYMSYISAVVVFVGYLITARNKNIYIVWGRKVLL